MQSEVSSFGLVWFAAVGASVIPCDVVNDEGTTEVVLHDLEWPFGRVIDHTVVMEPEDVERRLRGQFDGAVELQTHASVHVHVGLSLDHRLGFCEREREKKKGISLNSFMTS